MECHEWSVAKMFTGIVDHCGTIASIEITSGGVRLSIETTFQDLVPGESISVDGACLTAVSPEPGHFFCDLSPETLEVTAAASYERGSKVNLERALRLGDRLGGHWVSGHVDAVAKVCEAQPFTEFWKIGFKGLPPEQMKHVIKKGSISVQGVSLTINEVVPDGFEVMLIPHTLSLTNLSELKPGKRANIEFDWMVKVVLNEAQRLKHLPQEI